MFIDTNVCVQIISLKHSWNLCTSHTYTSTDMWCGFFFSLFSFFLFLVERLFALFHAHNIIYRWKRSSGFTRISRRAGRREDAACLSCHFCPFRFWSSHLMVWYALCVLCVCPSISSPSLSRTLDFSQKYLSIGINSSEKRNFLIFFGWESIIGAQHHQHILYNYTRAIALNRKKHTQFHTYGKLLT